MDVETSDKIFTSVGGVHIEFVVAMLNLILGNSNEGLDLYSARTKIDYPWFSIENVVRKFIDDVTCPPSFVDHL